MFRYPNKKRFNNQTFFFSDNEVTLYVIGPNPDYLRSWPIPITYSLLLITRYSMYPHTGWELYEAAKMSVMSSIMANLSIMYMSVW